MESNICSVFSKISGVNGGLFKNSSIISASGDIDKNQLIDVMLKDSDDLTDEDKSALDYIEKILDNTEYNKFKEIMLKNPDELSYVEKNMLENVNNVYDIEAQIKTGWKTIDGEKYYVYSDGEMVRSTSMDFDGKRIGFNDDGLAHFFDGKGDVEYTDDIDNAMMLIPGGLFKKLAVDGIKMGGEIIIKDVWEVAAKELGEKAAKEAEEKAAKEAAEAAAEAILKNLDRKTLFEDCAEHIFSDKHIKSGIMDLGKSEEEIMNSAINIVEEIGEKGMLNKEGSTQIKTIINGYEAEIRIYIKDGKPLNFDMWKGYSKRDMGNTIYYKQ